MAIFTSEQQDALKLALGYASVPNVLTTELMHDRSQVFLDRALALLDELSAIDAQLAAARSDSMAKAVGQLSLSYSQHVAHLKSEGTRSLHELSSILGVGVAYNKYSSSSISSRSYW